MEWEAGRPEAGVGGTCGGWKGPECQRLYRNAAEAHPALTCVCHWGAVCLGGVQLWGEEGSLRAFLASSQKLGSLQELQPGVRAHPVVQAQ